MLLCWTARSIQSPPLSSGTPDPHQLFPQLYVYIYLPSALHDHITSSLSGAQLLFRGHDARRVRHVLGAGPMVERSYIPTMERKSDFSEEEHVDKAMRTWCSLVGLSATADYPHIMGDCTIDRQIFALFSISSYATIVLWCGVLRWVK